MRQTRDRIIGCSVVNYAILGLIGTVTPVSDEAIHLTGRLTFVSIYSALLFLLAWVMAPYFVRWRRSSSGLHRMGAVMMIIPLPALNCVAALFLVAPDRLASIGAAFGPMYIGFASMVFLFVAVHKRRLRYPRCRQCGYERRIASAACPECGNAWGVPDGQTDVKWSVSAPLAATGLALGIITVMAMIPSGPLSLATVAMHVLPNRYQARLATATWWPSRDAQVRAITSAELAAEDREYLADCILAAGPGATTSTLRNWMESQVLAGRLSANLIERFYEGLLTARITGPTRAVKGSPFYLTFEIHSGVSAGSRIKPVLFLAGVSTDGGQVFRDRSDERYGGSIRPKVRLRFPEPGTYDVVVRLYVAVVPYLNYDLEASWHDDGTPVVPEGAVHLRMIDLPHTVTVTEAP